jgi:hypothetical protein
MKSMIVVNAMMKYADCNISNCNENCKILVIFTVEYLNKTRNPNIETRNKFEYRMTEIQNV